MTPRRHVVILLALGGAACGAGATGPAEPIANTADDPAETAERLPSRVSHGALWTCRIDGYDAQPCRFSREHGGWTLRKLLGSQRFQGMVTFPSDGAIEFDGAYFCPWGACNTPMVVRFEPEGPLRYVTTIDQGLVELEWNDANAAEYGGAGYGALTGDEQ